MSSKPFFSFWSVIWSNPYTTPPDGFPRHVYQQIPIIWDGSKPPPELLALANTLGYGWSVYWQCVVVNAKPWDPIKKVANRRNRLRKRLDKQVPLFADLFFEEETKRAYFNDATSK